MPYKHSLLKICISVCSGILLDFLTHHELSGEWAQAYFSALLILTPFTKQTSRNPRDLSVSRCKKQDIGCFLQLKIVLLSMQPLNNVVLLLSTVEAVADTPSLITSVIKFKRGGRVGWALKSIAASPTVFVISFRLQRPIEKVHFQVLCYVGFCKTYLQYHSIAI